MGLVNVTVSLDELRSLVPKFVNATTLEVGKELMRQAALMVRDDNDNGLLSITPAPGIDKGKDIGDFTVSRDINKVFVSKAAILSVIKRSGIRGARAAFVGYMKRNEREEALKFLNGQKSASVQVSGYTRNGKQVKAYTQTRSVSVLNDSRLGRLESISKNANPAIHKARRNSGGQVRRRQWSQLVESAPSLKNYKKAVMKNVGTLKAGWRAAARAAGLSLSFPPYINATKRASGSGKNSFSNPSNMYVELSNDTPNANRKITKDAVASVISTRQMSIQKALEYRMGKVAKEVSA
jgi:hypothetical protein